MPSVKDDLAAMPAPSKPEPQPTVAMADQVSNAARQARFLCTVSAVVTSLAGYGACLVFPARVLLRAQLCCTCCAAGVTDYEGRDDRQGKC